MSLGSRLRLARRTPTRWRPNAASQLGISVVAAAGNAGDLYDVGGSPGNAPQVIAVASSVDAYSQIDRVHVTAAGGIAGNYGAAAVGRLRLGDEPGPRRAASSTLVAIREQPRRLRPAQLGRRRRRHRQGRLPRVDGRQTPPAAAARPAACGRRSRRRRHRRDLRPTTEETFAAGITGSAAIPVVMVTKSAGDAIRTARWRARRDGQRDAADDFRQLIPADDDKVNEQLTSAGSATPEREARRRGVGDERLLRRDGHRRRGISFSGTSMATPRSPAWPRWSDTEHTGWTPKRSRPTS